MLEITRVQSLLGVAALAHVGFITAGALRLEMSRAGALPACYAVLSGTEGPYGFFAPGVSPELRATFHIEDGAGAVTTDVLETGVTPEANRRFKNLVTKLRLARGVAGARLFTLSWAKRMFGRHPSAKSVTVRVEAYDLPTMEAWRKGQRATWRLLYQETFVPSSSPSRRGSA